MSATESIRLLIETIDICDCADEEQWYILRALNWHLRMANVWKKQ